MTRQYIIGDPFEILAPKHIPELRTAIEQHSADEHADDTGFQFTIGHMRDTDYLNSDSIYTVFVARTNKRTFVENHNLFKIKSGYVALVEAELCLPCVGRKRYVVDRDFYEKLKLQGSTFYEQVWIHDTGRQGWLVLAHLYEPLPPPITHTHAKKSVVLDLADEFQISDHARPSRPIRRRKHTSKLRLSVDAIGKTI